MTAETTEAVQSIKDDVGLDGSRWRLPPNKICPVTARQERSQIKTIYTFVRFYEHISLN